MSVTFGFRDVATLFEVDRETPSPLTAEHIGRPAAPYPYVHTYLCSPGEHARLVETYRKLGLPLP